MNTSSTRIELLERCLLDSTTRAADSYGAGVALLFTTARNEPSPSRARLRAAAGFESSRQAQSVGSALCRSVLHALGTGQQIECPVPSGLRDEPDRIYLLMPLEIAGRSHGVLAIGTAEKVSAQAQTKLEVERHALCILLDYPDLQDEEQRMSRVAREAAEIEEQKTAEILELSESLFEQDLERLRHAERLGRFEKVKSDFIEKMSRELRTPLEGIIESIVSVLAGENERLSEEAQHSLRRALDEGTAYQRTLQNILDLWRIKQGEMTVQVQDMNLPELIDEAIFSIQDTLRGKPVEISCQLSQALPRCRGDLAKVNLILFLLLDNAAKFTQRGRIQVSAKVTDDQLICEVRDTGIGICADDQEFIFEEFFQVDDHARSRYRGAGLGLALVAELLGLLSGSCRIQSEVGSGTCARIQIPVKTA